MNLKKTLLIVAAALFLSATALFVLSGTRFFTPKPELECTTEGSPSSGFSDPSQGDCPISIDSYNAVRDWEYPDYFRPMRIATAVLLGCGIVVTIVAVTRKGGKSKKVA